jgi:dihydroorotase-like cyclic amidohydrolase
MSFDLLIRGATVVGAGEPRQLDVAVSDRLIAELDMPLNAHPPTVTGAAFDEKRRRLERSALIDIGLWGGLVPGGVEAMDELAARGVVGFKAFMCSSGIDDFPGVDDLTLYEGMCRAASLGLPVAVHAESEEITAGLAQRACAAGRTAMRDFLASRLYYRHRHSPFLGRTMGARVARTLVRGRTVFGDGRIVGPPIGRLLIPTRIEMESP